MYPLINPIIKKYIVFIKIGSISIILLYIEELKKPVIIADIKTVVDFERIKRWSSSANKTYWITMLKDSTKPEKNKYSQGLDVSMKLKSK